MSRLVFTR